ncbi:MAG: hypothetical protein LUH20_02925 [Lachnospiraceae bacterium]|nr:hypothetical protein [Lachnospiraceae bacterium]
MAAAIPLLVTMKKINQLIRGWINYYGIGSMKGFMQETEASASLYPIYRNNNAKALL